jgi:hypothetical protein
MMVWHGGIMRCAGKWLIGRYFLPRQKGWGRFDARPDQKSHLPIGQP